MPVEIKELIIRAVVEKDPENSSSNAIMPLGSEEKDALVAECVRQVLRIIKKSKER